MPKRVVEGEEEMVVGAVSVELMSVVVLLGRGSRGGIAREVETLSIFWGWVGG